MDKLLQECSKDDMMLKNNGSYLGVKTIGSYRFYFYKQLAVKDSFTSGDRYINPEVWIDTNEDNIVDNIVYDWKIPNNPSIPIPEEQKNTTTTINVNLNVNDKNYKQLEVDFIYFIECINDKVNVWLFNVKNDKSKNEWNKMTRIIHKTEGIKLLEQCPKELKKIGLSYPIKMNKKI